MDNHATVTLAVAVEQYNAMDYVVVARLQQKLLAQMVQTTIATVK